MRKFSANLGFLWQELPLADAIRAAERAGFDAVECHWPFSYASADVREALVQTQLPLLSLNTWAGDKSNGDFGLCALPGRQDEAV
ncbi:isomerase, partial [Solemya velum gill symbiont]